MHKRHTKTFIQSDWTEINTQYRWDGCTTGDRNSIKCGSTNVSAVVIRHGCATEYVGKVYTYEGCPKF